jgi:pimeloyl-ACP methyl ester carboxylesterase
MRSERKLALALSFSALVCAAVAPAAGAKVPVKFKRIAGVRSPGTPAKYNRVGILKTGSPKAKNVLVLNPGTSASAAYFEPLAKDIVARARGWQVWAVERRENLLEDQSVLDQAKAGKATGKQLFDYYLGWLADSSIKTHFQFVPDSSVQYAKQWGMNTEIGDLRRVVLGAEKLGGHVVVGGHSLGGSITTAYATWDFNGKPGAKGLSGLVYDDGGSNSTPVTADQAKQSLQTLQSGSPWLSFGGIAAPFAGLFQATGSTGALIDPNGPSLGQSFPLLPANLKPPVPVTNLAQFGYALDTKTSPPSLRAAQAHLGKLAASGDPRGWDGGGALTPIKRFAEMFSGTGLKGLDGTAWYHPMRLTIDAGAVGEGNANPAQQVLDVHTTEGHKLPRNLRIYAFGAALGGAGVPAAAELLAKQSHIPRRNLTLVNRQSSYAHNDPAGASPRRNLFLKKLVPFLRGIASER